MIKEEHLIPIYRWKITALCVDDYEQDGDKVTEILKEKRITDELIDECVASINGGYYNGGYIITNKDISESVLIFLTHDTREDAICTLMHEKRHLEDDILEALRIEDSEASAYLAGYLGIIFDKYSKYLLK